MIESKSLETQVRETLRDWIVLGRIVPGENLVESRLSDELGVSRTPLRAALSALERDGLVRSRPNHGWSVAPLDRAEAEQLYPVLYTLEDLAMRTAGAPDRATLHRLRDLNARLAKTMNSRTAVATNLLWHEALVSGCENRFLLGLLSIVRDRVLRYEHAYFRKATGTHSSHAFHERIQRALVRGDIEGASAALRDHWLSDLEFVTSAPMEAPANSRVPATTVASGTKSSV